MSNRHPLYLRMDQDGVLLHDFSILGFWLAGLAIAEKTPALPVNVEPLVRLCQLHRDCIQDWERWSYRYYYLELLAKEKKLGPIFWGDYGRLLRELHEPELLQYHLGSGVGVSPVVHARCQRRWQKRAHEWIADGVIITAPDKEPWLSRLEYEAPTTTHHRDRATDVFSSCLRFRYEPSTISTMPLNSSGTA